MPFCTDLPGSVEKPEPESIKAIIRAINIMEATGKLDHFCDPDPAQFGMLINPKTHEPYRYKDGTIMAFVRDRNSAFENASFGKKHTLGKSISFLRDNVYPAYNTQPLMGRKEALNDISEAGAAQREVIAHLRQEFHLEQQTTSLPPPTYQHGHSAEPYNSLRQSSVEKR